MNNKIKQYLGIDWGEKRIGLALADNEVNIASPFKVVGSIDEIIKVVKDEKVDKIVIGVPFKMSDVNTEVSSDFLKFLSVLKDKINIPIETIDERLSSKEADALVGDKKTKASRDAMAAMLILQNYLDRLK